MLRDLVVLELAAVLAGPSVGQFFAELGAEVLKVENLRTGGDVTRRWRLPTEGDDDRPSYFACCNWGKRSLALDLQTAEGQALVHALAAQSDVVLASFKPGDAERLGVDAATLRARNPRLVYGALTGYGPDDPRPGYDAVVQAESGFTGLNGPPEGPPVKMPVALVDLLAAHQLKEGLLLALWQRERTGRGGAVTVSLFDAAVSALANQATAYLQAGVVPQRQGSDHPSIAPYGTLFPVADGAVVLAVGTDRQFAALCAVLGLNLARDPRFATNAARVRHRAALHEALRPALARQAQAALLGALHAQHVPAGAVRTLDAVFAQAGAAALTLRHGPLAGLRQRAFTLEAAAPPPLAPPPAYGADTAAVLRARLGLDADALAGLAAVGAAYFPSDGA